LLLAAVLSNNTFRQLALSAGDKVETKTPKAKPTTSKEPTELKVTKEATND
jgi:hypothetical protein